MKNWGDAWSGVLIDHIHLGESVHSYGTTIGQKA